MKKILNLFIILFYIFVSFKGHAAAGPEPDGSIIGVSIHVETKVRNEYLERTQERSRFLIIGCGHPDEKGSRGPKKTGKKVEKKVLRPILYQDKFPLCIKTRVLYW